MFGKQSKRQTGFALLIFLVIMMGLGGIALTGFSQKVIKAVEKNRFEHNKDVLQQAKNALLMFAYNYPVTHSGQGPGRLPCPYNQIPIGAGSGYSGSISNAICESVGRLPWGHTNLELPEFKDADGEHLWYAVSKDFNNSAFRVINSDTKGTISIKDQTGNIIYDGAVAGIAAVIIAPGLAIKIDDDDNGSLNYQQVRNRNDPTDTDNFEPKNFLDSAYGGTAFSESNSSFTNSAPNGFISGPIISSNNELLINDQIIIIRAEEVIDMAEKATLDAYRTAVNDYLTNTGGVYPWLYNYSDVPDVAGLSSYFPADPTSFANELATNLRNTGRIPSLFAKYFTEIDSQPIESKLSVNLSVTYPIADVPVGATGTILAAGAVAHTFNFQTANRLTNIKFEDIADVVGKDGRLTATTTTQELFSHVVYFWDDGDGPATGIWSVCPDDGNGISELSDCHRESDGTPDPDGVNDNKEEILRLVVEFVLGSCTGETLTGFGTTQTLCVDNGGIWDAAVNFDVDYATPLDDAVGFVAATGAAHALITGTFPGTDVIASSLPLTVRFEIDRHYHAGETALGQDDPIESGALNLVDLNPGVMALGMRYYPELPDWAFDNAWHNSIMMAYADDYDPISVTPCSEGVDCIQINGTGGNTDNKISILTLAGQHNWNDDGDNNYTNDLPKIFDLENEDLDNQYDAKAAGGNDRIRIIQECTAGACP
jgi:hypothetical protein